MTIGRSLDISSHGCAVRRQPAGIHLPGLLRMVLAALILGVCGLGVWWLLTSPIFSVSRVESGAYRFTNETQLAEAFDGFLGRNIWLLSTTQVKRELDALPWIRDLMVNKRLPGVLTVEFSEWRPLLVVAGAVSDDETGDLVMVGDGRLLSFPDQLIQTGLPVLVGAAPLPGGTPGSWCLDPMLTEQVLELMTAIEVAGLEAVCPVDFLLAGDRGYSIVLQQGQGKLLVGTGDFEDRLERYMAALGHLGPGLEVDLRFQDRITWKKSSG